MDDILAAGTGVNITYGELTAAGERIVNLERAFIVREGFRREHDTLPRRMLEDPVPNRYYGPIKKEDLDFMLDEYYTVRGWDKETAVPGRRKLEELKRVADDFVKLGIAVK